MRKTIIGLLAIAAVFVLGASCTHPRQALCEAQPAATMALNIPSRAPHLQTPSIPVC